MIRNSYLYRLSDENLRLLKAVAFSVIFHIVLIIIIGGISLFIPRETYDLAGPLTVSLEPVYIPPEEKPVEELPPDPVVPEEDVPEPEPEPEVLPEPEPEVSEVPENLPEPETALEESIQIPEASPGAESAAEVASESPSGVPVPAAAGEPADASSYEGATSIPDAYSRLLNAPPREAETNTGGRSGETLTSPEEVPEWTSRGSGVYSEDTARTVTTEDAGDGTSSRSSGQTEGTENEPVDLSDLDQALASLSDRGEGVYMVAGSREEASVTEAGNAGENTEQISFLDGEGRQLLYSVTPSIPNSLRSIGLPEYLITVYFTVTPAGAVKDLKIDPPSGNNDLDASIKQSIRNWVFNSSGEAGDVRARVQFLIKVK